MATETGWTQQDRDNLARTIAESDITNGLLKNADIDALVDLFEAWTERQSPSDADELRKAVANVLPLVQEMPVPHSQKWREKKQEAIDLLRAVLNPQPGKETQERPREDFERPYFCAVRALRHLKSKNHMFKPLECDGCKEVALFLTEPGYRGDEHNPIGADCERSY